MNTVDQIEDIVAKMTPTVTIESVTDNGDGTQTLEICNTYWLRKYMTVTIDGNDYEILSFVGDTSITISSSPLVTVSSFVLTAPYYFHGTPIQINSEWCVQKEDSNKYPCVYLVEALTETFYNEEDSRDKDSNIRLFFLDSFSSRSDEVDAHYDNVIVPLIASKEYFVDLLNAEHNILPFDYVATNRIKVGVYTTDKGHERQIFSDALDGVEFVSTITFLRSYSDCSC